MKHLFSMRIFAIAQEDATLSKNYDTIICNIMITIKYQYYLKQCAILYITDHFDFPDEFLKKSHIFLI